MSDVEHFSKGLTGMIEGLWVKAGKSFQRPSLGRVDIATGTAN